MNALYEAWNQARLETPYARTVDQARALGVAEGALVASAIGSGTSDLGSAFADLIRGLQDVGPVMCLTRNRTVVHERRGTFLRVEGDGPIGGVYGPDIDLRLFWSRWARAFATPVQNRAGDLQSIQFFDRSGLAVLKVFATRQTDQAAWDTLVARHAVHGARDWETEPETPSPPDRPDEEVDVDGLRAGWRALADTHEFFPLLRRFGVTRAQALRLGPSEFVRRVDAEAPRRLLLQIADRQERVMVFVGNPGCVQIHSGTLHHVTLAGAWLNVLDPAFNLHVDTSRIASCWWVRKPSLHGPIDALEVFDVDGDLAFQVFGKRSDVEPPAESWRSLLADAVHP